MTLRNEFIQTEDAIYELVEDYIKTLLIRLFKLSNVKHTLEYAICKHVFFEWVGYGIGIYGDAIFKRVVKKINTKQKRKKFYAVLRKLENKGVVELQKRDGLIFLEPHYLHKEVLFNLIQKLQNSNCYFQKHICELKHDLDPKPSFFRDYALILTKDKKTLTVFEREQIKHLFSMYIKTIENKIILMYNKKEDKLLKIPYKTRFNSEAKLYEKIELFFKLFDNALKRFKDAVFLTLTLDPKNFNNVYDASKKVSLSLNRFLSYLKKRFSKKISYINVFEFQRNGLIHLHIVLFGFKWLMPQKVLSKIWHKYGMGKVVYLYRLKNDGHGFNWVKNRPRGSKEDCVSEYLVKYLKKAYFDINELSLFWLTNKRFFTYSRDLKENEEIKKVKKGFVFLGVFDIDFLEKFEDEDLINFIWELNHKGIFGYVLASYGGDYG